MEVFGVKLPLRKKTITLLQRIPSLPVLRIVEGRFQVKVRIAHLVTTRPMGFSFPFSKVKVPSEMSDAQQRGSLSL